MTTVLMKSTRKKKNCAEKCNPLQGGCFCFELDGKQVFVLHKRK